MGKKIVLVVFAAVVLQGLTTNSFAQYQSLFGVNQTSWNIKMEQLFGEYTDSLVVSGDTTIDGYSYKMIAHYTIFTQGNPQLQSNVGFLREDTTQGKAWYFSSSDSNERLIINMSLNMSDTFQVFSYGGGNYYEVDSVFYESNKKHIRLNLLIPYEDNYGLKFTMIEGAGPNVGISYADNQWIVLGCFLLCHYKDDTVDFLNTHPEYSSHCSILTGIENVLTSPDDINIYPNPASSSIVINGEWTMNNGQLKIMNTQGQLVTSSVVEKQSSNNNQQLTIDISNLSPGIYFLSLTDGEKTVNKKFVKE